MIRDWLFEDDLEQGRDRVVDFLTWLALASLFFALLSGCAGKQIDPMPVAAGDGLTPEVLEAWGDAREIILEAGLATREELDDVRPELFLFHRVDRPFFCKPGRQRKVRGCFDPRWNLVRYLDGSYSTIVHECLHAIFWGLDMYDAGHGLVDYP